MSILVGIHRRVGNWFIEDFDNTDNKHVRIRYGLVGGWFGIYATIALINPLNVEVIVPAERLGLFIKACERKYPRNLLSHASFY